MRTRVLDIGAGGALLSVTMRCIDVWRGDVTPLGIASLASGVLVLVLWGGFCVVDGRSLGQRVGQRGW